MLHRNGTVHKELIQLPELNSLVEVMLLTSLACMSPAALTDFHFVCNSTIGSLGPTWISTYPLTCVRALCLEVFEKHISQSCYFFGLCYILAIINYYLN